MTKRWPQATVKLVEDTANGPAIISALRKEVGGIIPVSVKGSKKARASAVSPFIESSNVFLPALDIALYDVDAFIEECTQFPNAAHDDQVDAMSQSLARIFLKGSGAKDWLESLAPPCDACGHPNAKGSTHCSKCSKAIDIIDVEAEDDEDDTELVAVGAFSLTSGVKGENPTTSAFNDRVREAISLYGHAQQTNPFGR